MNVVKFVSNSSECNLFYYELLARQYLDVRVHSWCFFLPYWYFYHGVVLMSKRMNYNLVEGRTDKSKYDVLETTTDQVIESFPGDKFKEARAFMRHLNLGGAFDGFTPTFILKKVA